MPPVKTAHPKKPVISSGVENSSVRTITTRSSLSSLKKENPIKKDTGPFPKRKAISPAKGIINHKRCALVNITNAIESKCVINSGKKQQKKTVTSTVTKTTVATSTTKISLPVTKASAPAAKLQLNTSKPALPLLPKSRLTLPSKALPAQVEPRPSVGVNKSVRQTQPAILTQVEKPVSSRPAPKKAVPANVHPSKCTVTAKPKGTTHKDSLPNGRRSSSRRSTLDSTDSSLYVSALSDVLDEDESQPTIAPAVKPENLPTPLINIDEEYQNDPFQCATYAHDIFEYLKTREAHFKIDSYMDQQIELNNHCRSVLIDWMVEIQENFELNHETLYLGVKLVDYYLSKIRVSKNSVQLVGATAMLIAAKYDERIPPAIEDFRYICDGSYKRKDILKMELNILRVIDFQLGFPLSYRFLRRYARCAKVAMPLLTLARFILEYTLMDYSVVTMSDSKMAAAALYLAFKMKKEQEWDDTLIYFSGYRVKDFIDVAHTLNSFLHQKPRQSLSTVRNKYSHKIFYEVAKTPLVSNDDL